MIKENEWVLIYFDQRRKFVVKVERGKFFHTDKGVVSLEDLINREYGETLYTNIGHTFKITKPSFLDLLTTFVRRTQVIYLKDASLIVALANISSGCKVVEGGTGSGFLTAFLANFLSLIHI